MKNLFLLLFLFSFTTIKAQNAADYFFSSKTNVVLEDMASGATTLIGAGQDDVSTPVTNLPFTFRFAGTDYTAFSVNTEGALQFGATAISPSTWFFTPSTAPGYPVLTPWWEDLYTANNGSVSYKTVVTGSTQKLVIEWKVKGVQDPGNENYNKHFQLWLFEGSNIIQFVYGSGYSDIFTGTFTAIANSNTDIKSVNTSTHTASSIETQNNVWPGFGRSYVFSPLAFQDPVSVSGSTTTAANCFGAANGTASIGTITGGDGNYTISWTGPAGYTGTGANISGLAAGNYHYTVTDASQSAPATGTVTVAQPNELNGTLTSTGTCSGSNGSIQVNNSTGGSGSYEYRLNSGAWQSSNTFAGLAPGNYNVQIRDAANTDCSKSLGSIAVSQSGAPIVTISASSPAFCNTLNLTANANQSVNYLWSNGEVNQTIKLGINNNDGTYSVTVTNSNGCSSTASYNYLKQDHISSYTILGLRDVNIGSLNFVNGAIGNRTLGKKITINEYTLVNGFAKASIINVNQPIYVTQGLIYARANVALPAMLYNTAFTLFLPDLNVPENYTGPAFNGNYKNIKVGKKAKATFKGNVFGRMQILEGADVTFTAADISIDDIHAEKSYTLSSVENLTTTTFAANSVVRVKEKIYLNSGNRIYGFGSTLYIGTILKAGLFFAQGRNTEVEANIYVPTGSINVGESNYNEICKMTGMFIANDILSDNFVLWEGNSCEENSLPSAPASPLISEAEFKQQPIFLTSQNELDIYPNPSTGKFTVKLADVKQGNVTLIVVDNNGRSVLQQTIVSAKTGQTVNFNLSNQPAGIYLVKMIGENGIHSAKLLLAK